MSKFRKRPWNLYKYKNSFLKTNFSLIIEYGMYLKCLQKPRCLGWFKTSQALRSAVWKTRLNSSKDNFIAKSFRLSTKGNWAFFWTFSFHLCISDRRIFNLEMQTPTSRASHFVDGLHSQRCQICFFLHPLYGWHDHWTFVGEWGMGDFTDLVCIGRIFSQTSLELEIFSPTYNGVRFFFSALYVMSDIFFQRRIFLSQEFICLLFSSRNQSAGHFLWNHP